MILFNNLEKYIDICFLPYVLWCLTGIALFYFSKKDKSFDSIRNVVIILILMLSWRIFFDLESKRYFLPTVAPTVILAVVGIVSAFQLFGKYKLLHRFLCLLLFLFAAGTIFNYFYVGRQSEKLNSIYAVADIVRSDFSKNGYRNAALVSNSKEAGRFFYYSDINGKYNMVEDVRNIQNIIDQTLYQYDAVYVVLQTRFDRNETADEPKIKCLHSYEMSSFPNEVVNSKGKKGYTISKIVSSSRHYPDRTSGLLRNGSFQNSTIQTLKSDALTDFPFFERKSQIQIPKDWRINFNHKIGFDFSDWKYDYSETENRFMLSFDSNASGVAIYNTQGMKPGNYYITCHAKASPDAAISLFLYAYDESAKLFKVQPVGYLRPQSDDRIDAAVLVREADLPDSTSVFRFGFIPFGKHVELEQVDITQENP